MKMRPLRAVKDLHPLVFKIFFGTTVATSCTTKLDDSYPRHAKVAQSFDGINLRFSYASGSHSSKAR